MKRMVIVWAMLAAACGADPEDGDRPTDLTDAAREPLDRAEAVQDEIDQRQQELEAALDEAEEP